MHFVAEIDNHKTNRDHNDDNKRVSIESTEDLLLLLW